MLGIMPRLKMALRFRPAIVDAIETDDGALKIDAGHSGDAHHFLQSLSQQRQFIVIAWR